MESFSSKNIDVNAGVQNRIEQLKHEYPKMLEEKSNSEFSNPSAITNGEMYGSDMPEILSAEISNYSKKLDEFYESFKQCLEEYISWLDVHCRIFLLEISIFNSGTCPAEDVDVFMHFPDGFIL